MIACPTADIRDGSAWLQGPGAVRLRCKCGSDDLVAISPGVQGEKVRSYVVTKEVATEAWCRNCHPLTKGSQNDE